jgi:hypothetical protein
MSTTHDPVALGVRAGRQAVEQIARNRRHGFIVHTGGGGIDGQLRPTAKQQAQAAGHPSVFDDRSSDPDWVGLPHVTERALRVLVAAAAATGNPVMVGHAREVSDHFGLAAFDDCPPAGMPRPQ